MASGQSPRLLNDLIRPEQERLRNRQPEGLGGFEVDHQLELLRPLDRQLGGLRTVQDLRDEDARPAKGLSETGPVGQQAAGLSELGEERHRRQPLLTPEDRDAHSMVEDDRRREDDHRAGTVAARGLHRGIELGSGASLECLELDPKGFCRAFGHSKLGRIADGIPNESDARQAGNDLPEELKLLGAQLREIKKDAGHVTAGPCERLRISQRDRIALQIDRHDGDGFARLDRGGEGDRPPREDDVDLVPDEVGRARGDPRWHAGSVLLHDHDLAFCKADLAEPLFERLVEGRSDGVAAEHTDPWHPPNLLGFSERRGEEAASERADERPSVHYSMTWSARRRRDCGMVRPRALAVLRLMTSSNFVGSSMGRSPGFAPLRILSTRDAPRLKNSGRSGPYVIRPPLSANSTNMEIAGSRFSTVNSATRREAWRINGEESWMSA